MCLKIVAGIQWTMKLEYPKRNCYGVLVSSVTVWDYGHITDEGCGFLTANCNSTSYPYSCTPCCDTSMQCAYDYQSTVGVYALCSAPGYYECVIQGLCTQATFFDHCAVVSPAQLCTNPTATVCQ